MNMKCFAAALIGATMLSGHAFAEEITVGMSAPLSGAQAFFGTTWHNGFKLYVDKLNADGGVNGTTVKYEQEDDKADPREGTLVAQKLCDNDNVVISLVNFNSGVAQSTLPIYEDCGLPNMTFASNPTLAQQGYKYFVRPVANDTAGALLPAEYALQDLGLKNAVIVNDKQVFGQGISEMFAKNFTAGGGKLAGEIAVTPTDVDFTAVLTQIKKLNPDAIYLGAVMPQLSLFARQMKDQGVEARLFVPDGGYTPDFIKQAGASAEGAVVAVQAPPMDATPAIADFAKLYKEKYGQDPGTYSVYGYAQGQILEQVLKDTKGLTREDLNEALHKVKANTVMGELEFDDVGELKVAPSFLYEVVDGNFKLVKSR
jgi:branched-chain amino acid transport system substrate-binding protein